jgi:hypothetical protein
MVKPLLAGLGVVVATLVAGLWIAQRATPTEIPVRPPEGAAYVVREGDSLSAIAERELGSSTLWRDLYEWNRHQITDPDLIWPGMQLRLMGTMPGEVRGAPRGGKGRPSPRSGG